MHRGAQWLTVGAIDGWLALMGIDGTRTALGRYGSGVPEMRVGGMGRHEGLRLGGDGGEDTFLLKALETDEAGWKKRGARQRQDHEETCGVQGKIDLLSGFCLRMNEDGSVRARDVPYNWEGLEGEWLDMRLVVGFPTVEADTVQVELDRWTLEGEGEEVQVERVELGWYCCRGD
ncbi:MAG: hypothetical protein Q9163_006540 [Psora crenata]